MGGILDTAKTTLIGGVLFLLPLIIVIVVVEKAISVARKVLRPVLAVVPEGSILGVSLATVASVAALLFLCLVAGVAARTVAAQRLVNRLENSLLGRVPAYGLLKSAAEGVAGLEDDESLVPVVVRLDDSTVLGLMTAQQDRVDTVAVYVPGAPSPLSGSVLYVERARVTRLAAGAHEIFGAMKQLGRESLGLLGGTPGAGAVS
jgi:uncharacterized membrane protein